MFSVGSRPHAADFDDHLWSIRRQALSQGIRWFWVANLLGSFFLLVRFYVYQNAELVMDDKLPWRYEWQLWAMVAANFTYPLLRWWLMHKPGREWLSFLQIYALLWGTVWALAGYATAVTEVRGGFSLAFMALSLLLMTSLIAFYCERSLCYCFMAPPWFYLLIEPLTVNVPFLAMHILMVIGLALLLETGRRMLYGWFVLAVAREYENLALACRLDGQAKQDPLTGLANRRYFNQVGELAIKQAMLQEHSFAVILLDVDFFKKLNDCYGHQRGDEVLVSVAGCLREVVRNQGDLVARYGGEEFVLLLPKATLAIAETVAQRVAAALARQALPHAESSVAAHVTVSQGIALWKSGESLDRVIARADEALYRAKAEGRNCYRIAPADTHPASD
ncbi:membrane-associated sensor domain-containing protein [Aeromonas allosaccharophila]